MRDLGQARSIIAVLYLVRLRRGSLRLGKIGNQGDAQSKYRRDVYFSGGDGDGGGGGGGEEP